MMLYEKIPAHPMNPFRLEYGPQKEFSLHPYIRLGTSSWTHDFWKGQIYHRTYKSEKEFNLYSLQEYANLGLFRIVEIDSTFYTPPKEETLTQYATLVPEDFLFIAKIWERLSIPVFPNMKRYGKWAGQENPSFLDPKIFVENFLPPFLTPTFLSKFGAFFLQFGRMDPSLVTSHYFLSRLEGFLEAFPKDMRLAIEVRNPELLHSSYITLLNRYHISHCFNQWSGMPSITEQMKYIAQYGGLTADFYFARLITPLKVKYEEAKKLFEPFHEVKRRDVQARQDVIRLARRSLQRNIPAFVIVNNRFEGNSPQTIFELEKLLIDQEFIQPTSPTEEVLSV